MHSIPSCDNFRRPDALPAWEHTNERGLSVIAATLAQRFSNQCAINIKRAFGLGRAAEIPELNKFR
jgi:hypothetical protein